MPLDLALTCLLIAVLVDAGLWLFLYQRPGPLGAPFALDPLHYVFQALYYGTWAQLLLAVPFLLRASLCPRAVPRISFAIQLTLGTLILFIGALDHEFQRFLGMHVTVTWLRTYASLNRTPGVIWDSLANDRGGAWSSLFGLAAAIVYPIAVWLIAPHLRFPRFGRRTLAAVAFVLLVLPTALWNWVPGGKLRQNKVRPALLLAYRELTRPAVQPEDPAQVADAVARFQEHYLSVEGEQRWRFVDREHPLHKQFVGTPAAAPARRPNFIVLSLETFRAKDMKSMNPELLGPAPTPFLDSLVVHPKSTAFNRYYASGVPTVHAFMALHASLVMHPSRSIPGDAIATRIDGFPAVLRRHGYRTLHFTGSDPDWDSQRVWLSRWYDEIHYEADDKERDRLTFRRAAQRIRAAAKSSQPFLAYISSISNHTPFHTPEPELSIDDGSTTIGALHNTMRYTDHVVRELYATLQSEPWFEDTVWIIVGDHGFDLGDRGESGGHENLRHETTWIPLIIHNADERLARGLSSCVGSHIDIAPTIAELASIWDDNSFMGHSLLGRDCSRADALVVRGRNYAYETAAYSLFQKEEAAPLVYAGSDLVQQRELAGPPASLLAESERLAEAYRGVIRHVIDGDRLLPPRDDSAAAPAGLLTRASTTGGPKAEPACASSKDCRTQ